MQTLKPDSYCGIYCGACSIALHGRTGRADEFAACLGGVPIEELACSGCKSDTLYAGCSTCSLRRCARERKVEHCMDCSDFPRKGYSAWQSVAKFLPHTHEAPSSLKVIKNDGVDFWLDGQKRRWSCPECGTPFSWYTKVCHVCGVSLKPQSHCLSFWRKLLCRFVLKMAYRTAKAKKRSS
jgi:hypothetical protein